MGVEKPVFYNFFNFIYSKISKKLGFRGSAFPFPPFSLEGGKEDDNELKSINCSY